MKRQKKRTQPLKPEDSEFLSRLLKENEKVINNVINNTLGKLYRYLAEETISELCLLACEKIDSVKAHTEPRLWLIIAAKNLARGMMRKHSKDLLNVSLDLLEEEPASTDNVFEDAVYAIWLEGKVPEKLIASLTKREREVYHKLYIEEKTLDETAEELGVTKNLVNAVHKNIRDKIKYAVKRKKF